MNSRYFACLCVVGMAFLASAVLADAPIEKEIAVVEPKPPEPKKVEPVSEPLPAPGRASEPRVAYVVPAWYGGSCMGCWYPYCGPYWGWWYPYYAWSAPVYVASSTSTRDTAPAKKDLLAAKLAAQPAGEFRDDYPKDPRECYRRGCIAYKQLDYTVARAYLNHAVRLNAEDARFWYFKAFAELAMENRELAQASVRRANELRASGKPAAAEIDLALQRLPEAARDFLADAGGARPRRDVVAARAK